MGRKRQHVPLRVLLNGELAGRLSKEPGGSISFQYEAQWLEREDSVPISYSLPLREDAYRGDPIRSVCENLLPDSELLRRRIAEKTGSAGSDAYSLLSELGRDCVGALQFVPDDDQTVSNPGAIEGEPINGPEIGRLLRNLARAPLGLDRDDDFRISVAGAQEKTALLYHQGKWLRPRGATPTTHLLKTQLGTLPNGIDLSNSVENEFYCLKLFAAFGLSVNRAVIQAFGKTKALVIERFDRRWTEDGRLLRLPQEDCCQALSCPPSRKYQSDGGPGMKDLLSLLKASDTPVQDQRVFLKAQILFWLIGATDGHAKNFSIFLGPGGRFQLTPLYDILTAQPSLGERQIERKQMKLAMSAGHNRHYRIDEIHGRHFVQTAEQAGLPKALAMEVAGEIVQSAEAALTEVEQQLPGSFPEQIHESVGKAMKARLRRIE